MASVNTSHLPIQQLSGKLLEWVAYPWSGAAGGAYDPDILNIYNLKSPSVT
jgi:hypothetical protein